MKHICLIIIPLLISCSDWNDNSTWQTEERSLATFTTIHIPKDVEVKIIQSTESKIKIHTAKINKNRLYASVENAQLQLTQNFKKPVFYTHQPLAKIEIFTPQIDSIYSRTQHKVYSTDTLSFPNIYLKTSLGKGSAYTHFQLTLNTQKILLEDNEMGVFEFSGKAEHLNIKLYGGNGRVDARNLVADSVSFFHRSNQHIFVRPMHYLEGQILSTGNVYAFHQPSFVQVSKRAFGKLIWINE